MTSNLHYFKYHCNSLVYNTDIFQYPIQKLKKKTKQKTLFTIYIKKYSEGQEHRRGTCLVQSINSISYHHSYNSKINRYTAIIKSSANIFGG